MYSHKKLQENYMSYNMRREKDMIKPASCPDIMVLSCEDGHDAHPFWYTHVVKIFHLIVCHHCGSAHEVEHTSMEPQHMDVLWVRWFGLDTNTRGGWSKKCLQGISFIPWDEPTLFGFLDPAQVVRGIHLIPNFTWGQTDSRLPPSSICLADDYNKDGESFYVN